MKRLLTWCALILCGGISAAAVARVVRTELRAEPAFDHAALEAWLLAPEPEVPVGTVERRDPSASRTVRRAAWLVEQDFSLGHDWSPFYKSLDVEARRRFQARWNLLLGEMFLQRARQFAALPTGSQEEFLAGQLTTLNTWYAFDDRGRRITGPALLMQQSSSTATMETGDLATRRMLSKFRDALAKSLADRMLRRFMPGAAPTGTAAHDDD